MPSRSTAQQPKQSQPFGTKGRHAAAHAGAASHVPHDDGSPEARHDSGYRQPSSAPSFASKKQSKQLPTRSGPIPRPASSSSSALVHAVSKPSMVPSPSLSIPSSHAHGRPRHAFDPTSIRGASSSSTSSRLHAESKQSESSRRRGTGGG